MGSDESHFNVSLIVRDKVTTRLCPQTTTFLKKKDIQSGIEPRPLCFKPTHKPSCRPPLVIPPDNSRKGAGLWMGLWLLSSRSRSQWALFYIYMIKNLTASAISSELMIILQSHLVRWCIIICWGVFWKYWFAVSTKPWVWAYYYW